MTQPNGSTTSVGITANASPADRLQAAIDALPASGVTLADVRGIIGQDALMLVTIFLTIVFLVPVSIPGVSTVFGSGILLIAVSRVLRRELWLPQRVQSRSLSTERLRQALRRGLLWLRRLERLSHPCRMPWATESAVARVVNDCALAFSALLLMAPFGLIPFSNTLPAIALLLLALGALQRDGACILAGHAAMLATLLYFGFLIHGGGLAVATAVKAVLR